VRGKGQRGEASMHAPSERRPAPGVNVRRREGHTLRKKWRHPASVHRSCRPHGGDRMHNSDLGTAGMSLAPLGTPTLTPTPTPARPPESFTRTWLLAGGLETPCPTPPGWQTRSPPCHR
jgi:hypothetical protein